jgi:WD40 repeat protein
MPGVNLMADAAGLPPVPLLENRFRLTAADSILAAAVDMHSGRVAAVSADGTLVLADSAGRNAQAVMAHPAGALCVAFSTDGRAVVTGGQDGMVRLWDTVTGAAVGETRVGSAWVERVSHAAEDATYAAAVGRAVVVLDGTLREVRRLGPFDSTVADLRHVGGGGLLVACYGGLTLVPRQGGATRSYAWKGSALVACASPDGQWLATGCQDDSVHVWKRTTGKDMQMSGYAAKPRALAWDAGSRLLATSGAESVTVWDFSGRGPQGSTPRELAGHVALVECLAFQNRGPLLASAGQDGALLLWAALQQRCLAVAAAGAPLTTLHWAPDDSFVMAGDTHGNLTAWNVPA